MATGTTYNDRGYLFRLQTLIIDGGTEVVRNIFNQRLPIVPFKAFLAYEKQTINRLRAQSNLTSAQYDLLYPQGFQQPNSADFDITLLICLLRNLSSLGLDKHYPWHTAPTSTDLSVEADLTRLRGFRNEIAHLSSTTGFQRGTFQTKWSEIEQVLMRLDAAGANCATNFKQTIDNFKDSPLDLATEERIQTDIQQWQELEKALDADIKLVKQDVHEMTMKMIEMGGNVEHMADDIRKLKEQKDTNVKRASDAKRDSKIPKSRGCFKTPFGRSERSHRRKQLQDDLIKFYRRRHSSVLLSPLLDQETPLLEFYVMPSIRAFRRKNGVFQEQKVPIRNFRDVFYNDENEIHREIYLSADAGQGKTAFTKRLTLAWCNAKKPKNKEARRITKEEMKTLSGFRFVFLLLLRDCSSCCDIDDMILDHIVSDLGHSGLAMDDLENILSKESYLVILDGLDEWTHPSLSIPHRKARDGMKVLTTTRPWKLGVARLKSSQIDQRLEITGLDQQSANLLKSSVLSYLCNKDRVRVKTEVEMFTKALAKKHISDLEEVPLLLMYLLFLWHDDTDLGETLCELYSNIIRLLLSRTVKQSEYTAENFSGNIPPCFIKHSQPNYCKQFYPQLTDLGRLAFETLFGETKEESRLLFDSSIAEQYLEHDCLKFCLETGIISQSKDVHTKFLEQKSKVSFSHKTMQEFLAALYMYSKPDHAEVQEIVLSKCKCIDDILEMSKTFVFISGLDANLASSISRELMKIASEDPFTREYRNSVGYFDTNPLKDLQDMYIACCNEVPDENEVRFCLQDVFIKRSCEGEHYRETLKRLVVRNKENIKSLYINMWDMDETPYNSIQEITEYLALNDLVNTEKLHCDYGYIDEDTFPLLNRQIRYLTLSYVTGQWGSWSRSLFEDVERLQQLEAINIQSFEISHSDLRQLYDYLSSRDCMRQIVLQKLLCIDHENTCTGHSLDLSQHSQLQKLTLEALPLLDFSLNMTSLEECFQAGLLFPAPELRSIASVSDGTIPITRSFKLRHLKMSASVIHDLVNVVQKIPKTVYVDMKYCNVLSNSGFETVRDSIFTSPHLRLLDYKEDRESDEISVWLEFETIEDVE